MSAGCEPIGLESGLRLGTQCMQKGCPTPTKHFAMTILVNCVLQVETTQEWIRGHLCRAQYVVPAIRFGLAEAEQLLYASFAIAPNPTMDGREYPIKPCGVEVSQRRMHDGHTI